VALELEDIVKRRDYKLKYVWGCFKCYPTHMWDFVYIHLFRTTDEYENGDSYIKQMCLKNHITKPFKKCSKCSKTYTIEDDICSICEVHVIAQTKLEVQIEQYEKEMNRLKSQLKKKRIIKEEFNSNIFALESKIRLTKISLLNLG